MTWIAISPKKTYKWSMCIWKCSQHHWSSEKYKSQPLWDITSHLLGWLLSIKEMITSIGEDMEKRTFFYVVGGNLNWYSHYGKTVWQFLKKLKIEINLLQQSHIRAYIQKNWNQDLKEISAFPCSLQHYSQSPRHGNNLYVINRWIDKEMYIHTMGCYSTLKRRKSGTSLVAQWLRIHLPMQGTWVRSLVQEDTTCHGATKTVHHNYWDCTLEPVCHNYWSPHA